MKTLALFIACLPLIALAQFGPQQTDGLAKSAALTMRALNANAIGEEFGHSIASAGDLNGDGYADIIVGAALNSAGGTNAGQAYIYFGGTVFDDDADLVLTGLASGDLFGWSVAGGGDINGDGFADVVVGAPRNDLAGADAGAAYVFFGGIAMNATADFTLTGAAAGDQFGYAVASSGDHNGDGYSDILVGAPYNDASGSDAGRAYIYFGAPTNDNIPSLIRSASASLDHYGYCVAFAGDMNGDGYSEIVVGAPDNDAGGLNAGRATIYYGASDFSLILTRSINGAASGDYFGASVAGAGDVNGDGFDDMIVGAFGNDTGGSGAGRAYIYQGSRLIDGVADVVLTGAAAEDAFGSSVGSPGDINGDGYSDVIVGSPLNDAGGTSAGQACVFLGGAAMDAMRDVLLTGELSLERFGGCVSGGGDVNGDGYPDILIGAFKSNAHGTSSGRAYVSFNSLGGTDTHDRVIVGRSASWLSGWAVAGIGDFDGDGRDDFAVGSPVADWSAVNDGLVEIFVNGGSGDGGYLQTDSYGEGQTGRAIASAGDLNGDGRDDFAVSAPYADIYGEQSGRVYVFYGAASLHLDPDLVLNGQGVNWIFGHDIDGAGDFNGDGFDDLIVGMSSGFKVFCGGATMDTVADFGLSGSDPSFGFSVAGVGDLDGDGYDDLVIGQPDKDSQGGTFGAIRIIYGAPIGQVSRTLWVDGTEGYSYGFNVSAAGDVNGDAYPDFLVIANGHTEVDLFFGGPHLDGAPDITFSAPTPASFGSSAVACAGDVNRDGYSDIVIGSGSTASVYFGGASPDEVPDIMLTSPEPNDRFGFCVASAGDVNGDGIPDIIVGAPYSHLGADNGGAAYLYLSTPPLITPRITAVSDVPFDQGGCVSLRWLRSGYDARGISRVTEYLIERSAPPGKTGFAWETIATAPALHNAQYSCTAATPNDSMENFSGTYYFRVTARTADPNEYWRSQIVSGHSVDNLPPPVPEAFFGVTGDGFVALQWSPSESPDFAAYNIYRGTSSGFDPGLLSPLATTPDTSWTDTELPSGTNLFYIVRAMDVHGNESGNSDEFAVILVGTGKGEPELPHEFALEQNYPNPFNPSTTIRFSVPEPSEVRLSVYDAMGRHVTTLVRGHLEAGTYQATFDGDSHPSGIYIARLEAGRFAESRKMLLLK